MHVCPRVFQREYISKVCVVFFHSLGLYILYVMKLNQCGGSFCLELLSCLIWLVLKDPLIHGE